MRNFLRIKELIGANRVNIACGFMIALLTLTGACAKQTAPSSSYLAFMVPANGNNGYQEIVCNSIVHKKIKIETKYCGTKAQLAYLDETGKIYEEGESGSVKSKDDQKIECRVLEDAGTKIKTKYCAAKALWPYAYVCASDNCEYNDDKKMECRFYVPTGTKLTLESCRSKAMWAEWTRINSRFAKNLVNEISREAAANDGNASGD